MICTPKAYIITQNRVLLCCILLKHLFLHALPIFTRIIGELLDDENYYSLQLELLKNPHKGDLVVGGGGIRKIRCAASNKGKSGGVRVIYYFVDEQGVFYMLYAYPKSKMDNLSREKLSLLRNLVKQELSDER